MINWFSGRREERKEEIREGKRRGKKKREGKAILHIKMLWLDSIPESKIQLETAVPQNLSYFIRHLKRVLLDVLNSLSRLHKNNLNLRYKYSNTKD